jgi:peptidylprolyl isomerase
MKTVTDGNSVKLHYKGTFPDGEVFDDSRLRGETMNILVGNGQLIKGFESALLGMTEGETKTINLTADEAYGQPKEEAIVTAPRNAFPEDFPFEEGLAVQGRGPSGQPVMAKILSFDESKVTLDHNHPLAGKDINFEIELVEIEETAE